MPAKLIDGKKIAEEILLDLKKKISALPRPPGLAVILIGNNPASHLYVRNKKRACEKIGIVFHDYLCRGGVCPNTSEEKVLEMIDFLNNDQSIDGIIVQLPIPKKFDTAKIINAVLPEKDVDGFHPVNKEKFLNNQPGIISPLVQAINAAIQSTGRDLTGKNAVIIANNELYSQTRKKDLGNLGLKVKIITPSDNLEAETKKADVLVAILGRPNLIKKSMVKPGAIVIDVGTNLIDRNKPRAFSDSLINANENQGEKMRGKWAGDVDPEVAEAADYLTPVPGGIGPLTVAMLLKNVCELAERNQNNNKARFASEAWRAIK